MKGIGDFGFLVKLRSVYGCRVMYRLAVNHAQGLYYQISMSERVGGGGRMPRPRNVVSTR